MDLLDELLADDIDIYDDNDEDLYEASLGLEVADINLKKTNTKLLEKKVPIGISYPNRNLLIETSRANIMDELKMPDREFVTAPKIFIVTLDGFISGIKFVEKTHMDCLSPTYDVPIIKSNYGEKMHKDYYVYSPVKRSNRGRNKKEIPENKKKKVKNLKSQITFNIRRPELERSGDVIIHKLFRSGNIQVSGLTYNDITSAKIMIDTLIALLQDTELVEKDENGMPVKPVLTSLCSIMENYKFNIIIDRKESINLMSLKREIVKNAYLLDSINDTNEPVTLLYVAYDSTLAAMKFVFAVPLMPKKKKTLITNVFSTGKVNILGCCGAKYARLVSKFLDVIMRKSRDFIVIYNRDCNWDNYLSEDRIGNISEEYIDPVEYSGYQSDNTIEDSE